MRALTVSRECLGFRGNYFKLKIYVSDPDGDVYIKDIPCKLLCTLGAYDTKTCPISSDEVTVFAVFSKATRNYKYDVRTIAAGDESVKLSGVSMCDYWMGMMFKFDGETSLQVRKDARCFLIGISVTAVGIAIVTMLLTFLAVTLVKALI